MKVFNIARHWFWVAPLVLGVVFIAGGLYMVSEGRAAKDEVRDAVVRENIMTSEDASIPNVQVTNAATAKAQAEAIEAQSSRLPAARPTRRSTGTSRPMAWARRLTRNKP